ncbi:MAG: glycosyltransferase family 4 protein [Pirellula sp.]
MNIAITSLYLPSGSKIGVGYQVHYLANELTKRGHAVTVFSQSGASEDTLYSVKVLEARKRFRTFGFAWDLRKVDFSNYDVLNAHGDDWFLWGSERPRHIHTFHGSCLAEMIHATSAIGRVRMAALALCEYSACFLPDELVAVSENTRRYIPSVKHVIPCGVELKSFGPGQKSKAPSVLFVGTMGGRKRGAMLLELFQREIRPRVPNAEFWAVCEEPVGGEGVRWFGRIPLERLRELFRAAWVFCLPSTYEGFGVPYIEAMASGTPVVATPNVGAREVTQEGKCGLLGRDNELAGHLVDVLIDPDLRVRLGDAGLNRAKHFSWDSVCEQYERLYRNKCESMAL